MVAVLNSSTVVKDAEVDQLVEFGNLWLTKHFAPAYGYDPTQWHLRKGGRAYVHCLLVDEDKDVQGALAFHDVGKDGHPVMVVMAKTIMDATHGGLLGRDGVLSGLLHELGETEHDPYCNAISEVVPGWFYWQEVCDAVQGMDFQISGAPRGVFGPNFVTSHWWNPNSPDHHVDYQGGLSAPGQVGPQGYQVRRQCGGEQQVGAAIDTTKPLLYGADGAVLTGAPVGHGWRTLKITGVQ